MVKIFTTLSLISFLAFTSLQACHPTLLVNFTFTFDPATGAILVDGDHDFDISFGSRTVTSVMDMGQIICTDCIDGTTDPAEALCVDAEWTMALEMWCTNAPPPDAGVVPLSGTVIGNTFLDVAGPYGACLFGPVIDVTGCDVVDPALQAIIDANVQSVPYGDISVGMQGCPGVTYNYAVWEVDLLDNTAVETTSGTITNPGTPPPVTVNPNITSGVVTACEPCLTITAAPAGGCTSGPGLAPEYTVTGEGCLGAGTHSLTVVEECSGEMETVMVTITEMTAADCAAGEVWDAGTCVCAAIVPITLSSFSGEAMSDYNKLMWTTTSEVNNEWQIIERNVDGSKDWTEVTRVAGQMNSTSTLNYEALDRKPMDKAYYRLHSIDNDGHEEFSDIISIDRRGNNTMENLVSVSPNPFNSNTSIQIDSNIEESAILTIVNIQGALVKTIKTSLLKGQNTMDLNLQELQSGVYILRVNSENRSNAIRLVKS